MPLPVSDFVPFESPFWGCLSFRTFWASRMAFELRKLFRIPAMVSCILTAEPKESLEKMTSLPRMSSEPDSGLASSDSEKLKAQSLLISPENSAFWPPSNRFLCVPISLLP